MVDALWITAIGMGVTFLALILLWGMMAGLVVLPFKDNEKAESFPRDRETDAESSRAKAAAVAAAIALAEQELSVARPLRASPTALVGAWQLGARSRQFYEKGKRR